jgi:SAM-dependent methyltransferase
MEPFKKDWTIEQCMDFLDSIHSQHIARYQPIWYFNIHHGKYLVNPITLEGYKNRLNAIIDAIEVVGGKKILDLGCCYGWNLFELANLGATGVGIDFLEQDITVCCCQAKIYGFEDVLTFYLSDVFDYILNTDEYFDCILALNLFHHMNNQRGRSTSWIALNDLSTRTDSMIINRHIGTNCNDKTLLEYTSFNRCRQILDDQFPKYQNMGRPLYYLWNE